MKHTDFQELVTEDGPLQFRFAVQDEELKSASEELVFQASELHLKFDPPDFSADDSALDESEMQGLERRFWEKYVFDENFLKDIPDFTASEFQPLLFDRLTHNENDE